MFSVFPAPDSPLSGEGEGEGEGRRRRGRRRKEEKGEVKGMIYTVGGLGVLAEIRVYAREGCANLLWPHFKALASPALTRQLAA